MRAFSSSISVVDEELEDEELPPPAWLLEVAEDAVEPDGEDEVLEDVLSDAAFVVDAVLLLSELDVVALTDVDAVVSLIPGPAAVAEVVDCICMILSTQNYATRQHESKVREHRRKNFLEVPFWDNGTCH